MSNPAEDGNIFSLTIEQKAEQFDIIMSLIKSEVKNSDTQRKIQLLTFAPQSCSRESLTNYFQVSDHVVRESRELFKYKGLFGEVRSRKGKLSKNRTYKT